MVPANTQKINREANEKVVSYSNTMATQVGRAKEDGGRDCPVSGDGFFCSGADSQADDKVTTYENLIKAYAAFQSGNFTSAANVLKNVNSDLLSVDAKEIYDSIYANVKSTMKKEMKTEGEVAFYQKDYAAAIEAFQKALELDDSDGEVWNLLAHSYRMSGD